MREFLNAYWQLLLGLLLCVNLVDFGLMGFDKHRAKTGGWRVRERTFFLLAALGGAPGAIAGMWTFRHKTRHWYFKFGLPAILAAQLGLGAWLWLRG